MRKFVYLLLSIAVCASFSACSQEGETVSSSYPVVTPEAAESSTRPSSEEAQSSDVEEASEQAELGEEVKEYAQVDAQSDFDNAKAYLTLNSDGTFVLKILSYDGMPQITGTYQVENGIYTMVPLETTAQNIQLSEIQDMRFIENGENLIYEGDTVGQTISSAEFTPYQ